MSACPGCSDRVAPAVEPYEHGPQFASSSRKSVIPTTPSPSKSARMSGVGPPAGQQFEEVGDPNGSVTVEVPRAFAQAVDTSGSGRARQRPAGRSQTVSRPGSKTVPLPHSVHAHAPLTHYGGRWALGCPAGQLAQSSPGSAVAIAAQQSGTRHGDALGAPGGHGNVFAGQLLAVLTHVDHAIAAQRLTDAGDAVL